MTCVNGCAAPTDSVSLIKESVVTYKTILVHLDTGKRCPIRLELAIRLARRFDAHLVGLHALTVVRLPSYAAAEESPPESDARLVGVGYRAEWAPGLGEPARR